MGLRSQSLLHMRQCVIIKVLQTLFSVRNIKLLPTQIWEHIMGRESDGFSFINLQLYDWNIMKFSFQCLTQTWQERWKWCEVTRGAWGSASWSIPHSFHGEKKKTVALNRQLWVKVQSDAKEQNLKHWSLVLCVFSWRLISIETAFIAQAPSSLLLTN